MADETEEKTKQTVPALERTAKGVAAHAAAVQERQWDKDRKVFRDPVIAMLALFTYAKLTPSILAEAEQKITALEKRVAEFEVRLTTIERFKSEAEAQTAEMMKGVEDMVASGKMPGFIEQLNALQPVMSEVHKGADAVTPIALPKPKKEADKKNGGAA